ncbi:IS66 family insertion sequence element accessory protein TnpB [Limosilactobacillus reuteri]|uniref:Mobile element protein n=1 Tax=Limosilactobacillus reuteri TaxID=1598 RepID=A0A0U5D0A5_LIMRT|nr:Mobile element protein [Limosilactobacillus reuteri subsp. porcinus]
MLVNWHDPDYIYLVCGKTDMRKGIDGLVMVIAENYGLELRTIPFRVDTLNNKSANSRGCFVSSQ